MSLAEDLQRAIAAPIRLRPPFRGLSQSLGRRSIIAIETEEPGRTDRDGVDPNLAATGGVAAPAVAAPDPSHDLLDRAEKSMTLLLARCRDLEQHIKDLDAWSLSRVEAAEVAADQARAALAALDVKLEAAQCLADALLQRAEVAEQAAERDRDALRLLQERIITAFGAGSDTDEVSAMMPDGG